MTETTNAGGAPAGMRFTDWLRAEAGDAWTAAVDHPFTVAIGDDRMDAGAYTQYLVEDRHFVDSFTSVIGYTLAKAPVLRSKQRLAGFIGGGLTEDTDYFARSFAELGIDPLRALAAPPRAVTREIADLMLSAARDGSYADGLVCILTAEWTYLTWGMREAKKPKPGRAYLADWIDIHASDSFQAFVGWLRQEMDRAAAGLPPERQRELSDRFTRLCRIETAFFEDAWRAAG